MANIKKKSLEILIVIKDYIPIYFYTFEDCFKNSWNYKLLILQNCLFSGPEKKNILSKFVNEAIMK